MRTTVRLPDDLLKAAKERAVATGRSLTQVIEDALRAMLAPKREPGEEEPVEIPTYGTLGVQPGVDLDDTGSLLDLMDSRR